MERLCKNCGVWNQRKTQDAGESSLYGSCRRYAPKAYVMAVKNDFEIRLNGEAIFPETCEDDWCGEFVPR